MVSVERRRSELRSEACLLSAYCGPVQILLIHVIQHNVSLKTRKYPQNKLLFCFGFFCHVAFLNFPEKLLFRLQLSRAAKAQNRPRPSLCNSNTTPGNGVDTIKCYTGQGSLSTLHFMCKCGLPLVFLPARPVNAVHPTRRSRLDEPGKLSGEENCADCTCVTAFFLLFFPS